MNRILTPIKLARRYLLSVTPRSLYHGTIRDHEQSIKRHGLYPSVGDFVRDSYGTSYDIKDIDEVLFAADKKGVGNALGAMIHHIAKKLGKGYHDVTDQEILDHGMLVKIHPIEVEGFKQRPEHGEPEDYYEEFPVSVEPGDYYTDQLVGVDWTLTGKKMLKFLQRYGEWPRTFGGMTDDQATANKRKLLTQSALKWVKLTRRGNPRQIALQIQAMPAKEVNEQHSRVKWLWDTYDLAVKYHKRVGDKSESTIQRELDQLDGDKLNRKYWDYHHKLQNLKAANVSAIRRVMNAAKEVMYHGTSSTYLRNILKEGLIPNPKQKQWQDIPAQFGKFWGVYFTRNLSNAIHAANNAVNKRGGTPLFVLAQLETNTPDLTMDEEGLVQHFEFSMKHNIHEKAPEDSEHRTLSNAQAQEGLERAENGDTLSVWDIYNPPSDTLLDKWVRGALVRIRESLNLNLWGSIKDIMSDREKQLLGRAVPLIKQTMRDFAIYLDLTYTLPAKAEAPWGRDFTYWIEFDKTPQQVAKEALANFKRGVKRVAKAFKFAVNNPLSHGGQDVVIHQPVNYRGANKILGILSARLIDEHMWEAVNEELPSYDWEYYEEELGEDHPDYMDADEFYESEEYLGAQEEAYAKVLGFPAGANFDPQEIPTDGRTIVLVKQFDSGMPSNMVTKLMDGLVEYHEAYGAVLFDKSGRYLQSA